MKDLTPFKNLILSVDIEATKFEGNGKRDYTVWTPYQPSRDIADDECEEFTWRIQVDRFTKIDNDPIAKALYDKFEEMHVPFEYELDYEPDTKYIHHIFVCTY